MADQPKADLERMLGEARTALEAMRHGERPAETTLVEGVGAAGDRVKVTAVTGGRLKSVELDPRVMRSAPAELAGQVVLAVNAALADLRTKAADAAAGEAADTATLGERLDELQAQSLQRIQVISQTLDETIAKITGSR